jgi:hypothetical protein
MKEVAKWGRSAGFTGVEGRVSYERKVNGRY